MIYENVLEMVGNTPLVKLNKICKGFKATVLAKIESVNPGNSIKDRIAIKMIEDAEERGILKPGGTIIEGTSGNTGMGLAIAAVVKGYKCICTMPDKQSKEKIDILRAVGVEVIITPTNVAADDPRSYYSVAKKLNEETPNSFYPNQYYNHVNRVAHYESTGPEIWKQTEGKISHFVAGVGTGGTISGVGRYLKEKNPDIQILGIDTYGSVFKKYHETGEFDEKEIYPYFTEGIGEDIIPSVVDFGVIDYFEKVTDKDAYLTTRRLAREEGILAGNSCGAAVQGVLQMQDRFKEGDVVVVVLPDHASRYLAKAFNDDWMRERGFLSKESMTAGEMIQIKADKHLITVNADDTVKKAVETIRHAGISQMPVQGREGKFVGAISENRIYQKLLENPEIIHKSVSEVMQHPFPIVEEGMKYVDLAKHISKENDAVLVKTISGDFQIITKFDIVQAFSS